jgi:DNA-binding transcriptional LysR family regulator
VSLQTFSLSRRANVVESSYEGKTFFQNFHAVKQKSSKPRLRCEGWGVASRLRTWESGAEAACRAAAQGLGVALVSMPYLRRGALQRVLRDWYVEDGNISIYYGAHKMLPGKTRACVDFVIEPFAEQQLARPFSVI